jgi:hypothetical protein
MGKYAGNMPGGAQPNPARKPYTGSANDYNLGIRIKEMVRTIPEPGRTRIQAKVDEMYAQKFQRQYIHDTIQEAIRLSKQEA